MRMPNPSFIWFTGSVVWWIDAAVALHYSHKSHAVLALVVACLFFAAGMLNLKTKQKHR